LTQHLHDEKHHTSHSHGTVDATILTSQRGIWAVKWSFFWMFVTAIIQLVVVIYSGSVALLADTIHNFGDAATAIPLWFAFSLGRRAATKRFTYGLGRTEDLAGIVVVLIILISAVVAGYESINRFFHPQTVENLWAVAVAAIIGFLGNEAVARFRIRIGKEIGSAALIADGYHARTDGFTSLAVLLGAIGVWMGFPLADPIVGLLITIAILRIVWDSAKSVFTRLLDGVDPEVVDEIRHAVNHTPGVQEITEVRVRWLGHRLHAELNIAVNPECSVEQGHEIAKEVRHQLLHHLEYLSNAVVHVDPLTASGEEHHGISNHIHSDLPPHSH
jgi:cation diffusion facilitator family transporter